MSEQLFFNGINATTGEPLLPPITERFAGQHYQQGRAQCGTGTGISQLVESVRQSQCAPAHGCQGRHGLPGSFFGRLGCYLPI